MVAFAEPLIALLFGHNNYTYNDVLWTAATMRLLLPFLIGLAGANIIKKVYFALEDRGTLLKVGAFGVALTGGLGLLLAQSYGVTGLAVALSTSTLIQLGLYLWVLHRRLGASLGLAKLALPLAQMAAASLVPAAILTASLPLGDWARGPSSPTNLVVAAVARVAAALGYIAAARLLKIRELDRVLGSLLRRIGR